MVLYSKTTPTYKFKNAVTGEILGIISDVVNDEYVYNFWDKVEGYERSSLTYSCEFEGMPKDLFPLHAKRVRLEVTYEGIDQDGRETVKHINVGIIDRLQLKTSINENGIEHLHLSMTVYTDDQEI